MKKYLLPFIFLYTTLHMQAQALKTDTDITEKEINTNLEVGCVAGSASVSLNGNATYSIPVFIPDGIRGMQPNVSVNYSSGNGNGLLGYGWNLNAYSAISYDTKNLYNDNEVAPNYIDGGSPYQLDGGRLIQIGSTGFRTESESFSQIIASSATAPASFTVITKSGITMEYGATANARIVNSTGKIVKWLLNKTSDNIGNSIEYTYAIENGETILKTITYTKNATVSAVYYNTITFNYTTRIDNNIYFSMEANTATVEPIYKKNKLANIEVKAEGQLVKKYDFTYADDGLYTYLNEVTENGYDDGSSTPIPLNSTIFKYGTTNTTNTTESFTPAAVSGQIPETLTGDFNGDGLDDLFVAYYTQAANYPKKYSEYKVYLRNSTGTGFIAPTATNSGTFSTLFPQTCFWNGVSGTVCSLYVELYVTDIDGDGRKEISIAKRGRLSAAGNARLFGAYVLSGNSTASTFNTLQDYSSSMTTSYLGDIIVSNYFLVGDFNGDNRTDWLTSTGSDNRVKLHLPALNTYNQFLSMYDLSPFENCLASNIYYANLVKLADFDSDGKDDIFITSIANGSGCQEGGYNNSVYNVSYNTATTQYDVNLISYDNASNGSKFYDLTKQKGDFNGDGKTDVFIQPVIGAASTANIRYSTGRCQTAKYTLILGETVDFTKLNNGEELFLIGDYNGDGKSDIAHYYLSGTTHNFAVYYSNGLSFKRELNTFTYATGYRPSAVADFNGDGRDDIIDTLPAITGAGALQIVYFKAKNQEFLLTKVKDGFERVTEFTYKLHTDPTVYSYTNPVTNTYPLNTIVPGSFAVSQIKTPDGTGVMSSTTFTDYSYADVIVHKAGKGYLGYTTIKSKDNLTTLVSEQTNGIINGNTNFYLFGNIGLKSYYSATPATLLTQQIPTYVIDDLTNKRYFLKNTKNISKNLVADIEYETNYAIDTNGNATATEQKIKACSSQVVKQTTTTSVGGLPDAFVAVSPSAIPSLPNEITVTNNYNGNTYSSTTKNTYQNGLLQTVINFYNTNKEITTTYQYDGGLGLTIGLLTKQTTTVSPIAGYQGYQGAKYIRYEYFDNKRTVKKTFTEGTAGELLTQEVLTYDKRFNIPTSVKNGIYTDFVTTSTIDAFGREITSSKQPNNINSITDYIFDKNSVTNGIYKVSNTSTATSNTPQTTQTSVVYFDRFGRNIKTTTDNFSGTTDATTTYDAFGRVYQTTAPDASNAGAAMTVTNNYFTTTANHFRLNNIVNSVNGTTQYTYNTASGGENKVKITAPSGEYKEQTTDATGRLIKSIDGTGSAGAITYEYNAQGNITKITAGSSITTMEYDAITGRQTKLTEPDCGTVEYTRNGYGELIGQKDQKTFEYVMEYDILGRATKKTRKAYNAVPNTFPATAPEEVITYGYVQTGNGKEQLQTVKVDNVTIQSYGYDELHRQNSITQKADATASTTTLTTTAVYNSDNSVQSLAYPQGVTFNYYYTNKGFLESVKEGTLEIYKQTGATKYNAPTAYSLNNGNILGKADYNGSGNLTRYYVAKAATPAVFNIQDLNMTYNLSTGNLLTRTDKTKGSSPNWQNETFTYDDNKDRLKTITTFGGSGTQTMQYDDAKNGNIKIKPDASITDYTYHPTKLHAVTNINYACSGTIENYKENQTIAFTPFNKAATLQQTDDINGTPAAGGISTHLITYTYSPDETRMKSEYKKDGVVQNRRYYFGNYEKLETLDAAGNVTNTKHIYYISGGNGLCAIATKDNAVSSLSYNYAFTDHLGSILKLTDNTGTTVAEQSFDAWGRMRDPNNWASYTVPNTYAAILGTNGGTGWLTRGYTGHEHVPQVDLINMNGRMYDAVLGRMLSPDNYVQDPTNSQSYNRYSYVLNNPLKYTDPSGWLLTSDVPIKAIEEEGKGGGGGGTVVGENGFFTTDRGLISEIAGVLNNGGTISWTPGTMILNGFGTVTNNGYGQTLNAGYTHIPGSVSVSSYYRNTGSYNYSNTRGSSFAGNVNYYRGGGIDMNNATAGIPAQYLSVGNGIGGAPTWVDKAENKINNFFSKYDKITFPAIMIPEKVLYSAKTLDLYNSISKIKLPFNFLGLNVNPATFYHSISATNAIGEFGSYLSIGISAKRLVMGQGSKGWNIMDGVVSFAATKNIYGAVFSTAYPGYKSIIQDIQNGNDLYENEVIKAFFIFPYPQKK